MASATAQDKARAAIEFTHQAQRLAALTPNQENESTGSTSAIEADFVTPQDPVVITANGGRLPAVPFDEAQKLNVLRDQIGKDADARSSGRAAHRYDPRAGKTDEFRRRSDNTSLNSGNAVASRPSSEPEAPLREAVPPSRTNPLFPPLPMYGPPTLMRNIQCYGFRISSFFLSLSFLGVIVLGSAFTSIPLMLRHIGLRLQCKDPNARRPFYEEEERRKEERREAEKAWKRQRRRRKSHTKFDDEPEDEAGHQEFEPTEGGKDKLVCDVSYYARRVGLDVEEYKVQTEDGFIITLWHVYDPKEYTPVPAEQRAYKAPDTFPQGHVEHGKASGASGRQHKDGRRKYPVLMIHGLLQSSGAYCTNDDDSLAFFLCKSGYDVWLGNNRCGFTPEHSMLQYKDPRMWAWNIRQMGVMDLPALVSRVLSETGFEKLGLICHSQGTTETFVALAKEQRPDLGQKISVFCALAPAAYAGPLIGKMYFKFMRIVSPNIFRVFFGIHAFIPLMMTMHSILPANLYGAMGYRVFSFLFNWTDDRWEQDLRSRMFQFAPVYVSSESMRWWLGRECFARQKCILATREEGQMEDNEDGEDEYCQTVDNLPLSENSGKGALNNLPGLESTSSRGRTAWYDENFPPLALWIAGTDDLVDGRRLLRRFEKGREPHVRLVHSKIIEEYEHLDVIWAIDSIQQVGREVREVLWKTAPSSARQICRVPRECEDLELLDFSEEPCSGTPSA
ncbi:MAG: hypothetical protein M1819_004900 [Sarea resinae]|nr:MAG: hypothetical protein M1819_004900 [Sarea resinae]